MHERGGQKGAKRTCYTIVWAGKSAALYHLCINPLIKGMPNKILRNREKLNKSNNYQVCGKIQTYDLLFVNTIIL